MLDDCDIKQRWAGVNALIERWLAERQSLIVQFCGLSGVHEFSRRNGAKRSRLEKFAQVLMDYVSAGHFEVYYQLLLEAEAFDDGSAELANNLFPAIDRTTESLLTFHDRYADAGDTDHALLAKHLSELGEILAERFELEDRLIDGMHRIHGEQVA